MESSSRREQLESLLQKSPGDSFLRYGVALEYVRQGQRDEGLQRLRDLIRDDPDYQAAYFQLGQRLAEEDRLEEAREALQAGIAAAQRLGNAHAAGEMEEFLSTL